ncbi:hypothetical protein [Bradyrhizobium sp. WYCCWR 12699]|uniref:hypothetical protein n=1 Tax=Bradyrhizobium sp. WYCCWR 12699 TaxID=3064203 RepID=UPI0028A46EDD|nr:hypothetical protein [Bradyrhizobium sp. WYCCWR 12699]MDT4743673.1 hypothetical protein [Bradyrhizobium sp. WYCCWR 12699]
MTPRLQHASSPNLSGSQLATKALQGTGRPRGHPGSHGSAAEPPGALQRFYRLFGPAPILPGDNAAEFDELLACIVADLAPQGMIEEIWTWDLAFLTWEVRRARRFRADLLADLTPTFLTKVLATVPDAEAGPDARRTLVAQWSAGEAGAREGVERQLAAIGATPAAVAARAFLLELEEIDRLERALASIESRRNAIIREFDRHRLVGANLREMLETLDAGAIG